MKFDYEYIEKMEDVRAHTQECEGRHPQQAKKCLRCDKEFYRKSGQLDWHWEKQLWCSSICRSNGLRKGRPFRERNCNWNGGRGITTQGYVAIYQPDHPSARSRKYVLEHRLVMEKHIGRFLKSTEVVHHINHDKQDNRVENLMLLSGGHSEHRKQHYPSELMKTRISNALKGRTLSEKHRKSLSEALKGNKNGRKNLLRV